MFTHRRDTGEEIQQYLKDCNSNNSGTEKLQLPRNSIREWKI